MERRSSDTQQQAAQGSEASAVTAPLYSPERPARKAEKRSFLKMKQNSRSGAPTSARICEAAHRRGARQKAEEAPERPARDRSELTHAPIPRPGKEPPERSKWTKPCGTRVGTAPVRPQHSKPSPHRGGDSVQGLNEPLTEGYSGPAVKDTEKRALEGTNCSRNLTASQGKNSQIFKGIPKKKKKKKSSTQCKIHNVTHPVNITKDQTTGLPWCPVVRNPPSKARHVCAIPGPGTKIPHAGGN